MTLQNLRDLLLAITPNVFHYSAWETPDKYIVWAEDSESGSLNADNKKQVQILQGTIDYFTKIEFDPIVQQIQQALNDNYIPWRLNSIQYEDETGFYHHEWIWEVDGIG